MKLGIVGLPNVGKSTLFNSLTKAGALAANYPFATIDPNVGIVQVPDERLDFLTDLYNSEKTIQAIVEFVDIAGLVKGASKGEGLGNQFLSHIREVDAIAHVVRLFNDDNIVHVEGSVDPLRDIETINLELVFSDLEQLEKIIAKGEKALKGDKKIAGEVAFYKELKEELLKGNYVRNLDLTEEQKIIVNSLGLLSAKPVIYVANVLEEELADDSNPNLPLLQKFSEEEASEVFTVCAKIEEEIALLTEEERSLFLEELGLTASCLDKLIAASYKILGYISFLTAGPKETRAWTIVNGTKAPQAAGKIHTDFEKGFIRAEIVAYDDLKKLGSMAAAKAEGLVRLEGKDYVMKDGDVTLFRFNV